MKYLTLSVLSNGRSKAALRALVCALIFVSYGFIRFETIEDPKIIVEQGKKTLVLPSALQQAVQTNFPTLRIATQADMKGPWAVDPGFPFVTWGDFNGDGLKDIAIILFNDQQWKMPIFHKTPQGYVVGSNEFGNTFSDEQVIPGPQAFAIYLVSKGETVTRQRYDEERNVAETVQLTFEFDGIYFATTDTSGGYIFWKNGEYQSVEFGT